MPALPLNLEQLEDRTVPSNFTAADVSDLIADIHAANAAGGSNTITLVAGRTFGMTAVDNTTDGATGLPVIAANDNLHIVGNGDTIERKVGGGPATPAFRLLDVAAGASLTLQNLTLQNGVANSGGAVYNQGTLDLNGVTVRYNTAQGTALRGRPGGRGIGGGIYSNGSLTLEGGTSVRNNQAVGGAGSRGIIVSTPPGGDGLGGGLYVAGGTAKLTGVTLLANTAHGGQGASGVGIGSSFPGGHGGNGLGGALYVAGGDVTLRHDTVTGNSAQGGRGGPGYPHAGSPGIGEGGGLYIDSAAAVCLDSFTQANVKHNTASTRDPDIFGHWMSC
jgi:hypothetical protein